MQQPEDVLAHFGVKGMKWGVRKDSGGSGSGSVTNSKKIAKAEAKAAKQLSKSQKKYDKSVNKNAINAYNKAADYANSVLIPNINKKYAAIDVSDPNSAAGKKYVQEYLDSFDKAYVDAMKSIVGERPK